MFVFPGTHERGKSEAENPVYWDLYVNKEPTTLGAQGVTII
jgi:hypothetical protein